MAQLIPCGDCRGFMKESDAECPNCGARASKGTGLAKKLLVVASGAMAAVTLSACYGPPAICSLPDGGTSNGTNCIEPICQVAPDGGQTCLTDGGTDGGHADGGSADAGVDAGQ